MTHTSAEPLHGAHQGLWQLGEIAQSAAIQAVGGLTVLGPVKEDAEKLVTAFAETGITEADLAGLRAQEEMLIRFPIHDRDSGLMNAIPRKRPVVTLPTPWLREHLIGAAKMAPFHTVRAPAQHADDHSIGLCS